MTTYRTGNPLGSKDPRDLYDNAENLDEAVNTRQAESWDDRFGVARKTWWGMEQDFQQFLINSGYENIGDYAAGLEITARNQIFWRDGELYRAGASLALPYTTTGDWGAEEGLFVAVGDQSLRQELASPDGASLIGGLPFVTPEMFGATGDGVADDSDALEAAIQYCAPYEWKGSLSETKNTGSGAIRAKLTGVGTYRITRPIAINPFLVIEGTRGNGFFQPESGGFSIIADFDNPTGFALDTAPFNSSGVREFGKVFSRNNWEGPDPSQQYTSVGGFSIKNILVKIPENRDILGALNRGIAVQSNVQFNSFIGGHISIRTSCTWGGSVRFNHMMAGSINLLNLGDVTCDDQRTNYLTLLPRFKDNLSPFVPPSFPDPEVGAMTANIHCGGYSRPLLEGNVLEHGDIGVRAVSQSSLDVNCYFEGINEYVVAAHTCSMNIKISTMFCPDAELFWFDGSEWDSLTFDFSQSVHLVNTIKDLGRQTQYVGGVKFIGSGNEAIPKRFFDSRIDYSGILKNNIRNIYVDGTAGNDTNSGLLSSLPLKTITEAFSRCVKSAFNRIHILSDCSSKYVQPMSLDIDNVEIVGGENRVNFIAEFNQVSAFPAGLKNVLINNAKLLFDSTGTLDDGYSFIFPLSGSANFHIKNSNLRALGQSAVFGTRPSDSAMCNISITGGSIEGNFVRNLSNNKVGFGVSAKNLDRSAMTAPNESFFFFKNW